MVLLHNLLRKRCKIPLLIHLLPQIRLCKHGQRVPRNLATNAQGGALYKVRHRLELALGDDL